MLQLFGLFINSVSKGQHDARIKGEDKKKKKSDKTGYNIYYRERYNKLKEEESIQLGQASKIIGYQWGQLSEKQKQIFNKKASQQNQQNKQGRQRSRSKDMTDKKASQVNPKYLIKLQEKEQVPKTQEKASKSKIQELPKPKQEKKVKAAQKSQKGKASLHEQELDEQEQQEQLAILQKKKRKLLKKMQKKKRQREMNHEDS